MSRITHHASRITHHASRITGLALLILSAASCAKDNPNYSDTDATVPLPDADPAAPDANLEACTPSTAVCEADVVTICDGSGAVESQADCLLGCFDGERCNKLDPSNGLAPHLDDAVNSIDVVFSGPATINTTSGLITDDNGAVALPTATDTSGPVDVFIIKVKSLTATDINVEGTAALAIVSDGDISISGIVNLSAVQNIDGPGALLTDDACRGGQGAAASTNASGGGGAGFGGTGARGGNASGLTGGGAGAVSGTPQLVPLRGGCPGGHGGENVHSDPPTGYADRGGAGGAFQLVSKTSIDLSSGTIVVNGGGGEAYAGAAPIYCLFLDFPCLPADGGGSGGAILLEAPSLVISSGSALIANGGGGACGPYESGRDGAMDASRPPAALCPEALYGNGGRGGAGSDVNGTVGGGFSGSGLGGGGGGGVGRIRVNLPLGTSFAPEGMVSPPATAGVLGLR